MSEVKVNKISPRTNCGTVQLGDSGDTITIPAGATITNSGTQSGFGRSGSVNWQTSIKTSNFTAVSGEGYFCDTSSGAFTLTLPASPSAGAIVSFSDYAQTFDSNALTIGRNSSNIAGQALDSTITTEGIAITLVYADSTKGWIVVESGLQSEAPGPQFIAATGGTVSTVCTNFKVHVFTGPGTFCVSSAGNAAGSNTVDYLLVAGGGGGGSGCGPGNRRGAGGAGAGGWRASDGTTSGCYSAAPSPLVPTLTLNTPSVPVSVQGFPITVGGGGPGGGPGRGTKGSNSIFSTITSTGGGSGAMGPYPQPDASHTGDPGGSGGALGSTGPSPKTGGTGNDPPTSPPQGNPGGGTRSSGDYLAGGGGGGIGGCGTTSQGACSVGGSGGAGAANSITGSPVTYAAGGQGGKWNAAHPSVNGGDNTGNGGLGGGGGNCYPGQGGGNGGSGIIVIRYKFQ